MNVEKFNSDVPGPEDLLFGRQREVPSVDPTVKDLVEGYGFPIFKGNKLNEPFWAAYYASHQVEIVFEPNEGEFYNYEDQTGLFVVKSVDSIRKELADLILRASRDWTNMEALAENRGERALHGVLAHLRGLAERPGLFGADGSSVHVSNCVIRFDEDGNITTGKFSPKLRSRNLCPIVYDRSAACPDFKKALLEHLDDDDRELLQKYGGQCLLGRNLTQRILILDGVGAASKGAFVLVTQGIVGPTNTYELRTEHLGERFEIGRMIGKTLLLGADVRAKFLSERGANRLKALVGGDTLEAERKISNKQVSVRGIFNVLITSNSRLQVRLEGDQGAWRRRLAIVRYDRPYRGKTIPDIHERLLRAEGSGILNFYLEGVQKLYRDIQQTGNIVLSERQRRRVNALLSESDSLRIFLRENLVSTSKCDLTVDEIISEYNRYATKAGWTPTPRTLAQRQLEDLMLELFGVVKVNDIKRDGRNQRGFRNVRFRQDNEEEH